MLSDRSIQEASGAQPGSENQEAVLADLPMSCELISVSLCCFLVIRHLDKYWSAPQDPQMEKRPCIAKETHNASPGLCWRCLPHSQRVERWPLFGLGLRCSGCSPPLNSLGRLPPLSPLKKSLPWQLHCEPCAAHLWRARNVHRPRLQASNNKSVKAGAV